MNEPKEYLARYPVRACAMRYTPENKDAVEAWVKKFDLFFAKIENCPFDGWFVRYSEIGDDSADYGRIYYETHEEFCAGFLVNMTFEEKNYE
jgi:hypothetical protein